MKPCPLQSAAWSGVVTKRNLRVEANFEEILEDYFNTKLPAVGGELPIVEQVYTLCIKL